MFANWKSKWTWFHPKINVLRVIRVRWNIPWYTNVIAKKHTVESRGLYPYFIVFAGWYDLMLGIAWNDKLRLHLYIWLIHSKYCKYILICFRYISLYLHEICKMLLNEQSKGWYYLIRIPSQMYLNGLSY